MKLHHRVLVGVGVFLSGGMSYYLVTQQDLPGKVEKQGKEIEKIIETTDRQAGELERHEGRIVASDQKITDHEKRIVELAKQMGVVRGQIEATEARLAKAEEEGKQGREQIETLRTSLATLGEQLESLRRDQEQRLQVLETLKQKAREQDAINVEIDRRLRTLEKKEGAPEVSP